VSASNSFGPWTLNAAESKRLDAYESLRKLVASNVGELDKLYGRDKQEQPTTHVPQMYVNAPGLVCRAAADLVLPEPPTIRAKDGNQQVQARLDALALRSRLYSTCWRALYWVSALGDGYLTIADVPQGQAKAALPVITFRRAINALGRNVRTEDAAASRAFLFKGSAGGLDLYTEHVAGAIKHYAYKGAEKAALPEGYQAEIQTKENAPLCVHLAALRGDDSDEAFGESDFDGTEDFVFEISNRLRQVSRILDRHADPGMNVPDGALDENNKFDVRRRKVFERGVGGEGAEYITWQSQLQEAYAEMDRLLKIIGLLTETPLALWGLDENGEAESGRALKFKLLAGLGKARRSGHMLRERLAEAVVMCLRREDVIGNRTPQDYAVSVELSDKFIADEIETAQQVQTLRTSQGMSIRRAVQVGQGLTGDALEEEVAAIEQETQQASVGLESQRFGAGGI